MASRVGAHQLLPTGPLHCGRNMWLTLPENQTLQVVFEWMKATTRSQR